MITHLYMQLDETLSLLGQSEALQRVQALPGVFNIKACGPGYKVDLVQSFYAMSVTKKARGVNCVSYFGTCKHLAV